MSPTIVHLRSMSRGRAAGAITPPAPSRVAGKVRSRSSGGLRPEIQALRAAAVALVVIYHLWPSALPGGFVGVDVFFAISGFLITSLLLREVDRTGGISLWAFWARRARRILPAALVTLLFCAVATIVVVPEVYWRQFLTEIRASTEYVQNWHLAASAVDYLGAANGPSSVQHFWSLSAEEQFYLVWPVLILLALSVRRGRARIGRRSIAIVLSAFTALSLAYSIYDTARNPAAAYFVTPTRAWEFGAGGLLALIPRFDTSRSAVRSALSWVGIAAIVLAALRYSAATPFPGDAALTPVLGALAVMWAGAPARRWAPTPVLSLAPIQFIGDVSYSVYLWHWPLLILAPFVTGRALDTETRITILMLTILAAWLTKLLIEDPVRAGRFLTRRRPRWTFAFAAAATAVVIAVTDSGASYVQAQVRKSERESHRVLATKPRCFGAAARDREHPCDNPRLRFVVVPSPLEAARTPNAPCTWVRPRDLVPDCAFGVARAMATGTFAVVGDSHAQHWRAALQFFAQAKRWWGHSIAHTGCEFSMAATNLPEPARSQCVAWNRVVPRWFTKHREVRIVFVAEKVAPSGQGTFSAQEAGYIKAWKTLPASVTHIIVIRDTPEMRPGGETVACVQHAMARRERAGLVCSVPRSIALKPDPAAVAASRLHSHRVQILDLTHFFCDARLCYPVIGGALVYKDTHHLTRVFATTLGPFLRRRVDGLMASWKP